MKIFSIMSYDLETLGIDSQSLFRIQSSFNAKKWINILCLSLNMFTVFIHILLDINTFNDFVDSVYRCMGVVATASIFMSFVWQTAKLLQLIRNLDCAVRESKYQFFYCWLFSRHFLCFLRAIETGIEIHLQRNRW